MGWFDSAMVAVGLVVLLLGFVFARPFRGAGDWSRRARSGDRPHRQATYYFTSGILPPWRE